MSNMFLRLDVAVRPVALRRSVRLSLWRLLLDPLARNVPANVLPPERGTALLVTPMVVESPPCPEIWTSTCS